jgi:hypothetical protein
MTTVNKYRRLCDGCGENVFVWGTAEPAACPKNTGHTLNATDSWTIVDSIDEDTVSLNTKTDELDRPMLRAESRDPHDTTYFTTQGDKWTQVTGESVGTGDGSETEFYLDNPTVKEVTIKLDGVEQESGVTICDGICDGNESTHFQCGKVTFDTAPESSVVITADYKKGSIGNDVTNRLEFEFSLNDQTQTKEIEFIDPIHIKDGVCFYKNGSLDSKMNVYLVCPAGAYYYDNNGNPGLAQSDLEIAHYVIEQPLNGSAEMGIYFDVESRSTALPVGYKIKVVVENGSGTNLEGHVRLEINRQRTIIL